LHRKDEEYAKEIGADGYFRDAYEAVKLAKRLSTEIMEAKEKQCIDTIYCM